MKKTLLLAVHMLLMWTSPTYAQWIPQASGQYNTYDWVNLLRISDEQHAWAGISNINSYGGAAGFSARMARTADGGNLWQTFELPDSDGYDVWGLSVLGPDTAFVSLNKPQSNADRLYKTTDGGQTWNLIVQDTFVGYQVYFQDHLNGLLFRGPYNTRFTTDGGLSWNEPLSMPAGLASQSIFYYPCGETEVAGSRYFTGLEDGHILRTSDVGQTWEAFQTPVSTPISDLAFEDEHTGLALAAFHLQDGNTWLTGSPSQLFKTTDGGQTWSEIPQSQLPWGATGCFVAALAATGAAGEYIMEARPFDQSGLSAYSTFRSADGGQSWQEISTCPTEHLGVIEFLNPTTGWAGNGLTTDAANDAMLFKWGQPDPPAIVLRVDMGDIPVAPEGVFVASNLNQWAPAATPMTLVAGSLWTVSIEVPTDSALYYYFVNGSSLAGAESVPAACGIPLNGQPVRQATTLPCRDNRVPEVLFGHCLPDGELEPQTTTICPAGGEYLICETFDAYPGGKVGPQATFWTSYGCNFDGTEGDDCDVDLHGYDDGFANYSGRYALHPNGGAGNQLNQYAELQLGDLSSGRYELSFQLYVPRNNFTYIALFFDYSATYSSIDLNIAANGTLTYNKYNGETFEYLTDASFNISFDTWHEVRWVFDLNAGNRTLWWDGVQVHTADDSQVNRLVLMPFGGGNGNSYLVDDIKLKDLLFSATQQPRTNAIALQASPNPAYDKITIQYRLPDSGPANMTLLNSFGQEMLRRDLNGAPEGGQELDVTALPTGVYLLRIAQSGAAATHKVVVQH